MTVLEQIAKLKAEHRREQAARQQEEQNRQDRERRARLDRISSAISFALDKMELSWLLPFLVPIDEPPFKTHFDAAFEVPGHRRISMTFRKTSIDNGEWVPATNEDCELQWSGTEQTDFGLNLMFGSTAAEVLIASEIAGWTPPGPDRDPTPEVEHEARRAWDAMTQEANPLPADLAIDLVQDETGDRDEAVAAIHAAAARWLDGLRPEQPVSPGGLAANSVTFNAAVACRGHLLGESYTFAENCRQEVIAWNRMVLAEHASDLHPVACGCDMARSWLAWAEHADRTIRLCREVSQAAYPEPAARS